MQVSLLAGATRFDERKAVQKSLNRTLLMPQDLLCVLA